MTGPAVTARSCPQPHCYAPQTACMMGFDLGGCAAFKSEDTENVTPDLDTGSALLPWTGLGLGADDIALVASVGRPSVLALVGAASAGKTTALAATFLALRHGERVANSEFAGSFTLHGWQIVSSFLQWPPYGEGGFPPHTAAVDVRSPCLLHLRLRDVTSGGVRELLLSDMPGEWFTAWAFNDQDSPGASWLAQRADAYMIFADSQALASPQRGLARLNYETLARRVQAAASGKPVVPVLSKSDVEVPAQALAHVIDLNASLFRAETTGVSVRSGKAPVSKAVSQAATLAFAAHAGSGTRGAGPASDQLDDPFLRYRSATLTASASR